MSSACGGSHGAKADIRRLIGRLRADAQPSWRVRAGLAAQQNMMALPEYAAARAVCLYLSVDGEVGTEAVLDDCWRTGRKVCVPAYDRAGRKYAPVWFRPGAVLKEGPWKVPEPAEVAAVSEAVDIAVVPGVAFDRACGRLGHGQGCYDRLLADPWLKDSFKVGLAFGFQVVDAVPMDPCDVWMDAVVTEQGVHRRAAAGIRRGNKK